jgi:hypothetical protein
MRSLLFSLVLLLLLTVSTAFAQAPANEHNCANPSATAPYVGHGHKNIQPQPEPLSTPVGTYAHWAQPARIYRCGRGT